MSNLSLSDEDHIAALYNEHRGWLYHWLRQKLNCDELASDLIQSTFVRVLLKTDKLAELREPRAYLTTIAYGLINDHWRHQKVERVYLEALEQMPAATQPSEEERAEAIETIVQIDAMLDKLAKPVRRTFLLSQLEGLTYRAIAVRLGVSERMVKKYMAQAMLQCLRIKNQSDKL